MKLLRNILIGILALAFVGVAIYLGFNQRKPEQKPETSVVEEKAENFKITEEEFSKYMYRPEIPDPELVIRTSGEFRISNFLLWDIAYSEFYIADTYWPDFDEKELEKAILSFNKRDRRYGGRNAK